jgi:hypothetical protein
MSNIELVKRGLQAFCTGDTATLDQMTADDFIFSGATPQPVGKTEFLAMCQANHAAFSDFDFNASDFHEDGDVVTYNTAITATHTGPLALIPGIPVVPATGKRIQIPEDRQTSTIREGKLTRLEIASPPGGGIPAAYAQVGSPLPMP